MREIKFRAIYRAEWVYGNFIKGLFKGVPFFQIENSDSEDFRQYQVDEEAVGQFTGLKDKNGKDIYEGDIVSSKGFEPKSYLIEFIEGGFCLTNKLVGIPIDVTHMEDSTGKHFEIIGNIHQNPELL